MSLNNVIVDTAKKESAQPSVFKGVSESAILRSGDYLSYYYNNGSDSGETRIELVSSNGKYSLKLNGDAYVRISNNRIYKFKPIF